MSKRRLGKGIDALLGGEAEQDSGPAAGHERAPDASGATSESIVTLPLERIQPNPNQPRKSFSPEALEDLAASIREKGVIQPIVVEAQEDQSYQIVAGERRYRAAKLVGLFEVPAIVRSFTEAEKLEIALIENLQREDLNAIEEAQAFAGLIRQHGWTQDELARRLGMSRTAIANSIRLLKLSEEIQEKVARGVLSAGHARAVLSVENKDGRASLVRRIEEEGLSVREAEALAGGRPLPREEGTSGPESGRSKGSGETKGAGKRGDSRQPSGHSGEPGGAKGDQSNLSPEAQAIQKNLIEVLGTNVKLVGTDNRGQLRIEYYSKDELGRLAKAIEDGMSSNLTL